ncbi:MAG: hypothetical protein AAB393_13670, partial [Bacteroidota bacterium]
SYVFYFLTICPTDTSVFAPMWYSIRHDTIFINPNLYVSLAEQIEDAHDGHLDSFILRFHEELHRAQEMKSRWGQLWQFLHQTNQMDQYFHRPGEESHAAQVQASKAEWLRLNHDLTGTTPLNPNAAAYAIGQWRERMAHTKTERNLLKEIQAYWLSFLTTVDELYPHLYQHPHGSYTDLYRVETARFDTLCETMDDLYAAYDGDFDKLAAFVGNADSIADFEQKAKVVIETTEKTLLEQRREQMWQEKQAWKETTARLAQEVLK